jgi:hypothetical protein
VRIEYFVSWLPIWDLLYPHSSKTLSAGTSTSSHPQLYPTMTDVHTKAAATAKSIVIVSWSLRADHIYMEPEILSFINETSFRSYVKQFVLEDPDQCVRLARSWRQAQAAFPLAVKDNHYLDDPRRVRVADIGTSGLHLVRDLAPEATLNWSGYHSRWQKWYQAQPEVTMYMSDALMNYVLFWETVPDVIESVVDPSTPLEEIIEILEEVADCDETNPRKFEVFVSERSTVDKVDID